MKITPGEWKTRDGQKAIVAASDVGAHPLHYWVGWMCGQMASWNEFGRFIGDEDDNDCDIVEPWVDPVPWDWSTTPPWINWIAMDANGVWYIYDKEPSRLEKAWSFDGTSCHRVPASHPPKWSGDWRKSKTMRPGFNGGAK